MAEYEVRFGVNCWHTNGFGDLHPDYLEFNRNISAFSDEDACRLAGEMADEIALSYDVNHKTNEIRVNLLDLNGPGGRINFNGNELSSVVSEIDRSIIAALAEMDDDII